MNANPLLGVILHAVGGFAAGSFYIPFKKVKGWAWESYWLMGGFFSWIIAPWVVGLLCPDLVNVLRSAPAPTPPPPISTTASASPTPRSLTISAPRSE